MIQISATMRILVAIEPVDLRKGIDGLAQLCREKLSADPISGCLFIFRSRRGTTIKALAYDGQGYWLAQKRLSQGRFRWWPEASEPAKLLEAYEAQLLLAAGDVSRVRAAPMWRPVKTFPPLAFQKKGVHTAVDGGTPVSGPGAHHRRHPLYKRTDRGAPGGEPARAVPEAM